MRLGMTVQEEERRPASAMTDADDGLPRLDPLELETIEHVAA
jgi:hypothetical protein